MTFLEATQQLEQSQEFKQWKGQNQNTYLAHMFTRFDQQLNQSPLEIGYYHPDTDKITVFEIKERITIRPPEEAFKKEESIKELQPIQTDDHEALRKAKTFQATKYPAHDPIQGFLILQNHHEHGTIFNITFFTKAFAALNIKMDAKTHEVKDHQVSTFFDMRAS